MKRTVDIKIHKRFDLDLISLHKSGYRLTKMFEESLVAYANGNPIKFKVECTDLDIKSASSIRCKVTVTDEKACILLNSIKKGYQSALCRQILKDALSESYTYRAYFDDDSKFRTEYNDDGVNLKIPDVVPAKDRKDNVQKKEKTVSEKETYVSAKKNDSSRPEKMDTDNTNNISNTENNNKETEYEFTEEETNAMLDVLMNL